MAGSRWMGMVGVVWFVVGLLGTVACGQDLPESWKSRVAKQSAAEWTNDFLISRYKWAAALVAQERGISSQISLDDRPVLVTRENAASLARGFEAETLWYAQQISDSGYPNLAEGYLLEPTGDCSRFGFVRGPILLTQEWFELVLWQNGYGHKGAVCKSAIAFEHNQSPEIRLVGTVEGDAISLNFKAVGFAAGVAPKCSVKMTPVKKMGPEFGAAYLDRAVALLDQDDYERASADLDRAIELNPKLAEAYFLRSQLRSVSPDPRFLNGKLAVEDAKQACELTAWNHWQCLAPLACAYAEAGDFDAAIETMKKAVPAAPLDKQKHLSEAIDKFRQKKPMRYPLHTNMPAEPISEPDWFDLPEKSGVGMEVIPRKNSFAGKMFQVKTSGLPTGTRYRLWTKGVVRDWLELPDRGFITEDGSLALERDGAVVPMSFGLTGFQKGESFSVVLVPDDRSYKVTFKFIPRPLVAFDATSGYGLEAELLNPEGDLYLLTLKGFGEDSSVTGYTMQLSSSKEVTIGEFDLKSSNGKPPTMVIAAGVYGSSGDIVRLRFVGKKGEVRIALPWGDRLTGK